MTFQTNSQIARAAAPAGGIMKTPDYLSELVHRDIKPFGWRKTVDQVNRLHQAEQIKRRVAATLEAERKKRKREAEERLRREKIARIEAVMCRGGAYLSQIRKHADTLAGRPLPGDFNFLMRIGAEITKCSVNEILGDSRRRSSVIARHCMIRVTRLLWPGLSTPEIGRKFNRDHTSVLWALGGCRKGVKPCNDREEKIEALVDEIMVRLKVEQNA